MTTNNENTPAPAATGNEGHNESAEYSSTRKPTVIARMNLRGRNTGYTYGTYAGDDLPQKDWVPVLIPREAVIDTFHGDPVPMIVSPEDIKAHDQQVRARQRRQEIDRQVREQLSEHEERIRAEVEARMDTEEGNNRG